MEASHEPRRGRCRFCGYDLRGAGSLGACPECGRAFIASSGETHEADHGAPRGPLIRVTLPWWAPRIVPFVMIASIVLAAVVIVIALVRTFGGAIAR